MVECTENLRIWKSLRHKMTLELTLSFPECCFSSLQWTFLINQFSITMLPYAFFKVGGDAHVEPVIFLADVDPPIRHNYSSRVSRKAGSRCR